MIEFGDNIIFGYLFTPFYISYFLVILTNFLSVKYMSIFLCFMSLIFFLVKVLPES